MMIRHFVTGGHLEYGVTIAAETTATTPQRRGTAMWELLRGSRQSPGRKAPCRGRTMDRGSYGDAADEITDVEA